MCDLLYRKEPGKTDKTDEDECRRLSLVPRAPLACCTVCIRVCNVDQGLRNRACIPLAGLKRLIMWAWSTLRIRNGKIGTVVWLFWLVPKNKTGFVGISNVYNIGDGLVSKRRVNLWSRRL